MALEVANLKATIEFAAKGEAQAKQAAKSVQDAVDSLGTSIDAASSKTQQHETSVNAAMQTLARMQQSYDSATSGIEAYSSAIERNMNSVNTASSNIVGFSQMVSQLTEQMGTLSGAEAEVAKKALGHAKAGLEAAEAQKQEATTALELAKALKVLEERRDSLLSKGRLSTAEFRETFALDEAIPGGIKSLTATEKRVSVAARGVDREVKLATRSITRLRSMAGRAAGEGGRGGLAMLVRNFSGIASASRGGVTGMSMMATSLGRLGPIAIVAAVGLALIWKTVKSLGEMQQVSHIAPLSDDILALGEASMRTENQMKPLVQQVRNMFSAEGFVNVDALTREVFRLAEAFKNLTPSGTIEESLNIISAAIRGNVTELGKLEGVATGPYVAMLKAMSDTSTEAERMRAITEMIGQQQIKSANDIAAANARNSDSLEELAFAWKTLTETVAEALAGSLGSFIQWLTDFTNGIIISTEKVSDLIDKFEGLSGAISGAFSWALRLSPVIGDLMRLSDLGGETLGVEEGARKAADAIEDAADATEKWSQEFSRLEQIQQAQKEYKAYLGTIREGQSAISAVKSLGDALIDLENKPNPQSVFTAMAAFQTLFALVQAGGLQALDVFEKWAKSLGFGPEVDKMVADSLRLVRDVLEPMEEEMNNVGVQAEKVSGPVNTAASSFANAGNVAATASGQVAGLRSELGSIAGDYTVRLNVITSGSNVVPWADTASGSFAGSTFASSFGDSSRGTPTTNVPQRRAVGAEVGEPSEAVRRKFAGLEKRRKDLLERRGKGDSLVDEIGPSAMALARSFGGGGGGGGGGAARDRNATIEEIRAFIEQVNKAIMSGIRGGIVYSTAGNAIPIGGPGEFVKNEGGVNIGVINLRGVWDFADPAAKREIVRQLQEALVQYQKEVA